MNAKQKLLVASIASAALISGGTLAQHAFAQTSTSTSPESSLVAKIAAKFNLNQADVQAVFTEDQQARQAQMQQKEADRLTQAVTDGQLTATQKDLIIAKQKEMQAKMDAARASGTDPKTTMQQDRKDLEAWATANNIDMKWLRPMGGRGHGGPGGPGDRDRASTTTPASTPAATN